LGNKLSDVQRNGAVKISIKEQGPVLAELRIESKAPGVEKLVRDVRLVNGFDYVEMTNVLDSCRRAGPASGRLSLANCMGRKA